MTRTALYRHYDASGALLYVGISLDPAQRGKEHAAASWFNDISSTTVEWHETRHLAQIAEACAIVRERPKFNIQSACRDDAKFYEIGLRVKSMRLDLGLSQAQFAKLHGFKVTQLCNWEVGFRRISIDAAITLCDAYDMSLDWIFRGEEPFQVPFQGGAA